eukprot:gb/GEZN01023316.1/.p1 GENE.gb/GEZN01023316.1/~~gb/GEZN01023316.1/.p1  ORF type:complete len:177 (+),score=7.90 gb/GEZN01023316.1/:27-557(+)
MSDSNWGDGIPETPHSPVGGAPWSTGLFDCFGSPLDMFTGCCVPTVRWTTTMKRAGVISSVWGGLCLFGFLAYGSLALITAGSRLVDTEKLQSETLAEAEVDTMLKAAAILMTLGFLLLCLVLPCVGCCYRGKLRKKYAIKGNTVSDYFAWLLCQCCALVQEGRHVDEECSVSLPV